MNKNIDLIFKGYVPCVNKIPTEKLNGRTTYYTLDNIDKNGDWGGVLKENIVQLDFDNIEQAETVLKILEEKNIQCFVMKTPRPGIHLYFENNKHITKHGVDINTAINLKCDVGVGSKIRFVALKRNGIECEWLQAPEQINRIPYWLHPTTKSNINFWKLKEGGRNDAIYKYTYFLVCQNKFSKEEIKDIINIINRHLIENSLSEEELASILTDKLLDSEPMSFYEDKKFLFDKFAKHICSKYNVISLNGVLHFYGDGYYICGQEEIEKCMIKEIETLNFTNRNETIKYLKLIAPEKKPSAPQYIPVRNGVLDLKTKKLFPYSSDFIFTSKVNVDFNPNARSEIIDKTFDKICCGDKQLVNTLYEMFGYCLYRDYFIHKAFILTGQGSNGKSTLLEVLIKFLGEENICSVDLKLLCTSVFATSSLLNKLANIADDCSSKFIDETSVFKQLTAGNMINAQFKNGQAFDFKPYAKMILSYNEPPRVNDTTYGFTRRLHIIPFNAEFKETDPDFDPMIKYKLTSEASMQYLLLKAVDAVNTIIQRGTITTAKSTIDANNQYILYNNQVLQFLHEPMRSGKLRMEEYQKTSALSCSEVYTDYSMYCHENGYKVMGKKVFEKEVIKAGFEKEIVNGVNIFKAKDI